MRGEDAGESFPEPEISLEGAAYLPDDYIPEPSQKLHLYRRLSRLEHAEEVEALHAELRDRFGAPPPEVERLLANAALGILGSRLGVERILIRGKEARLNFREQVVPRLAALQGAFRDRQLEVEVRRAMPLSLLLRRHGAEPLTETLVRALQLLVADRGEAA
jgi:transcription-repair coupling factor (superfamily II helicase)